MFKLILLSVLTIILNVIMLIVLPFKISDMIDVTIYIAYIILNIGLFYYIYATTIDIIKIHSLKAAINNKYIIDSVATILTTIIFKFNSTNITSLLSRVYEQKVLISIISAYLPLTNILTDNTLIHLLESNDKELFNTTIKEKLIVYIKEIEIPYNKLYALLGINLFSICLFFYLLS